MKKKSRDKRSPAGSERRDDRIFLFGRKPLLEILARRPQRVVKIFLTANAKLSPELNAAIEAHRGPIAVTEVTADEIEAMAGGVRHQGVAAELRAKPAISLEELIDRSFSARRPGANALLVLDEISDPHNLGAIMRAAAAAGAAGLVLSTDRSAAVTPAVRKASAGASEIVDTVSVTNLSRALEQIKSSGYWLVGTALDDTAQDLFDCELPGPTAVVLGSEGRGLRELTKKKCDLLVKIPVLGQIDSLNVSQAAAVILYELVRREAAGTSK